MKHLIRVVQHHSLIANASPLILPISNPSYTCAQPDPAAPERVEGAELKRERRPARPYNFMDTLNRLENYQINTVRLNLRSRR